MNKIQGICKIINKINNKMYIGQSRKNSEKYKNRYKKELYN